MATNTKAHDPIHTGICLAEEAVRDIMREALCGRLQAAKLAYAGTDTWGRGYYDDAEWEIILGAAESQLRAIIDSAPR